MWWGQDGSSTSATHDSIFVLGGYDRAKIIGTNFTAPLSPTEACSTGMNININNVIISWPNGTQKELLTHGEGGFSACLQPDWPMFMDMKYDYFANFETYTGTSSIGRSFGTNFYGMLYPNDELYQGDLILSLSGDLQATIRNSQLVIPDRAVDNDSGALIANLTTNELLINSLQGSNFNDAPRIAYPFLTAMYLLVDHDAGTFTLWNAAPVTDEEDLVAIGTCKANTTVATSSSSSPSSHVSRGAIAGMAIGAVIGVAIIAALVAFLVISHKRRSRSRLLAEIYMREPKVVTGLHGPQEVGGESHIPSWLKKEEPPAYNTREQARAVPGLYVMPEPGRTAGQY